MVVATGRELVPVGCMSAGVEAGATGAAVVNKDFATVVVGAEVGAGLFVVATGTFLVAVTALVVSWVVWLEVVAIAKVVP